MRRAMDTNKHEYGLERAKSLMQLMDRSVRREMEATVNTDEQG